MRKYKIEVSIYGLWRKEALTWGVLMTTVRNEEIALESRGEELDIVKDFKILGCNSLIRCRDNS